MLSAYFATSFISIHALREEGDYCTFRMISPVLNFNPRPPRGGRQALQAMLSGGRNISIHALREEGDAEKRGVTHEFVYFNPRPPRGGRRFVTSKPSATTVFQSTPSARRATRRSSPVCRAWKFQSTPSARRATADAVSKRIAQYISIHALREEGDPPRSRRTGNGDHFNPRPPRGGRPKKFLRTRERKNISIHALREEGDSKSGEKIHHVCSIIHTCAQFEKELYEGSGEMQNKSC